MRWQKSVKKAVLRLPPHHCEFNPNELIGGKLKERWPEKTPLSKLQMSGNSPYKQLEMCQLITGQGLYNIQ
jgi:hypothetical protein